MNNFAKVIQVRWSDLDPNFHMLHSAYYDLGAYVRICLLTESGITPEKLRQNQIGPIIFREECIFRKEISFTDQVKVDVVLIKARRDLSRFSMKHRIVKNAEQLAAEINVDLAWMDLEKRKLAVPPESFIHSMDTWPKSPQFEWAD